MALDGGPANLVAQGADGEEAAQPENGADQWGDREGGPAAGTAPCSATASKAGAQTAQEDKGAHASVHLEPAGGR